LTVPGGARPWEAIKKRVQRCPSRAIVGVFTWGGGAYYGGTKRREKETTNAGTRKNGDVMEVGQRKRRRMCVVRSLLVQKFGDVNPEDFMVGNGGGSKVGWKR